MARRTANMDDRMSLFGDATELVRSVGEPFVAYMKANSEGKRVSDFHDELVNYIPAWRAIRELREARFHEGVMYKGAGAESTGPMVLRADPGGSVTIQLGDDGFFKEYRTDAAGNTRVNEQFAPSNQFDFVSAEVSVTHEVVRVPEDLELAIAAWAALLPKMCQGWKPHHGPLPP